MISQGDVYWVRFRGEGSEPDGRRPVVVVQTDRFNHSRLNTVVVAAMTSRLHREAAPGNVRVPRGEANLPRPSVVNVTALFTVDKSKLVDKVGVLSSVRLAAVVEGLSLVLGLPMLEH